MRGSDSHHLLHLKTTYEPIWYREFLFYVKTIMFSFLERRTFFILEFKLIQELNNLRNEVTNLEDNKKSISEEITTLNKDNITVEIDKKKKLNNKIIIKSKNQLLDDNKKLQEENEHLKSMNYQYKTRYNDLKEKDNDLSL